MALSRYEMEDMALDMRKQMGAKNISDAVDPLKIQIEDADVITFEDLEDLDEDVVKHLSGDGKTEWSAMSVPLDNTFQKWIIVRNHLHNIERQRVSLLEEYWHIMLGHEPTRVVKIGDTHGRTFESEEEDEAFFLASATLLPRECILKFVSKKNKDIDKFAKKYGVSKQLVEYRIKRLGQWYKYKPKKISLI